VALDEFRPDLDFVGYSALEVNLERLVNVRREGRREGGREGGRERRPQKKY